MSISALGVFEPFSMWQIWLYSTVKIKMGSRTKPAIKAVSITDVKQKKTDSGWKSTYTIKVKLEEKPGALGLVINGKKVKGNKTLYSAKFKTSGKIKGKEVKVSVCSYADNELGCYSAVATKKVKVS